jgi:hypothetical protein
MKFKASNPQRKDKNDNDNNKKHEFMSKRRETRL